MPSRRNTEILRQRNQPDSFSPLPRLSDCYSFSPKKGITPISKQRFYHQRIEPQVRSIAKCAWIKNEVGGKIFNENRDRKVGYHNYVVRNRTLEIRIEAAYVVLENMWFHNNQVDYVIIMATIPLHPIISSRSVHITGAIKRKHTKKLSLIASYRSRSKPWRAHR